MMGSLDSNTDSLGTRDSRANSQGSPDCSMNSLSSRGSREVVDDDGMNMDSLDHTTKM
jgi:hypothetical protein